MRQIGISADILDVYSSHRIFSFISSFNIYSGIVSGIFYVYGIYCVLMQKTVERDVYCALSRMSFVLPSSFKKSG